MKYCVIFLVFFISAGCSTGLHQREIRECRENAFQNVTLPMAVIEAQYKDCLSKKKEMQAAEQKMAAIENVLDVWLQIVEAKKSD